MKRSTKAHLPAGTRWRRIVHVVKQLPLGILAGGDITLPLP